MNAETDSPERGDARALPLLLMILVGAAGFLAYDRLQPIERFDPDAELRPVVARGGLADAETSRVEIFDRVAPSVVHVRSPDVRQWRGPFGGETVDPGGTGTGFVWNEDGYIVTNEHVVKGREQVEVNFSGRESYRAQVIGRDAREDIAVLKLIDPPENLRPIQLGTSQNLRVGQTVFAIGNPFGLTKSLTAGIVSALDRVIETRSQTRIDGVIQTDAAINPGNSGGPLLDSAGLLIGMNTAIYSPSGTNAGIGFAIPVDRINQVATRMIRGLGARPVLGIQVLPVELSDGSYRPYITELTPGGPAERAGLIAGDARSGDVIVAIDGEPVSSVNRLIEILANHSIGDRVIVQVLRAGAPGNGRIEIEVQLGSAAG